MEVMETLRGLDDCVGEVEAAISTTNAPHPTLRLAPANSGTAISSRCRGMELSDSRDTRLDT